MNDAGKYVVLLYKKKEDYPNDKLDNFGFIDRTGLWIPNQLARTSDPIPIKKGSVVEYKANVESTDYCIICETDKDNNFIRPLVIGAGTQEGKITIEHDMVIILSTSALHIDITKFTLYKKLT